MRRGKMDMSEYIAMLENFIENQADEIVENGGSVEEFKKLLKAVKSNEPKVAKMAIKQYGSIDNYTKAMKSNLDNFTETMEAITMME